MKSSLAFIFMSFRFVPFIVFVVPLYLIYQRVGLHNTHLRLILAYQLMSLPFTIWVLRSFLMEVPIEIQEAAAIDGCSWFGVLTGAIFPLSLPGLAVTVILGFMFCSALSQLILSLMVQKYIVRGLTMGAVK